PISPALVVMNTVRNYVLADQALRLNNERRRVENLISWKPPPHGWVRLNTDGACRDDGLIGCGGIIRGSEGE
ncbi:putative ribonuclease H protein, partial [Trifolium medium]|nr:putative ribonuclease H protein [Trifolium medium]